MKTILTPFLAGLLLSFLGTNVPSALAATPAAAPKLKVVTSFLPMTAHAKAIAGDTADVRQLLDKETGLHDFQLRPDDVKKIASADLFIINGAGLEEWLNPLVSKAGNPKLVVVDASEGIRIQDGPEAIDGASTPANHDHHGHDGNPHIWLDPVLSIKQVNNILQALVKADPANAASYKANATAYIAQLKKLDADFRATLQPIKNKNLVTFHDAFPYLAARYNLNYVGFLEEFPEKDPSPKLLANLVSKIRDLKIGVIFAENGYSPELLKKIAAQTGAKVSGLDTLEVGVGTANSYLERMQDNLASLKTAFSSEK